MDKIKDILRRYFFGGLPIDERDIELAAAEIRAECPVRKAALEFVTDSYRPEPKHDAERFDKLCEALNYKPPKD